MRCAPGWPLHRARASGHAGDAAGRTRRRAPVIGAGCALPRSVTHSLTAHAGKRLVAIRCTRLFAQNDARNLRPRGRSAARASCSSPDGGHDAIATQPGQRARGAARPGYPRHARGVAGRRGGRDRGAAPEESRGRRRSDAARPGGGAVARAPASARRRRPRVSRRGIALRAARDDDHRAGGGADLGDDAGRSRRHSRGTRGRDGGRDPAGSPRRGAAGDGAAAAVRRRHGRRADDDGVRLRRAGPNDRRGAQPRARRRALGAQGGDARDLRDRRARRVGRGDVAARAGRRARGEHGARPRVDRGREGRRRAPTRPRSRG